MSTVGGRPMGGVTVVKSKLSICVKRICEFEYEFGVILLID